MIVLLMLRRQPTVDLSIFKGSITYIWGVFLGKRPEIIELCPFFQKAADSDSVT